MPYRGTQTTRERLAETRDAIKRERSMQHSARILSREDYYLSQKAYIESQIDALFKRLDDLEASHLNAAAKVEASKAREIALREKLTTIEDERRVEARERMKRNYHSPQGKRERAATKIKKLADEMLALSGQVSPAIREKILNQLKAAEESENS